MRQLPNECNKSDRDAFREAASGRGQEERIDCLWKRFKGMGAGQNIRETIRILTGQMRFKLGGAAKQASFGDGGGKGPTADKATCKVDLLQRLPRTYISFEQLGTYAGLSCLLKTFNASMSWSIIHTCP